MWYTVPSRLRGPVLRVLLVLGVIAALFAATACGSGDTPNGANGTNSGPPAKLTVAVGGSSIILSDLVIAYEKNFFKDENLDVELQYLGVSAAQAAIAGNVDLAYSTPTQTLSAIASGRPVKTIWSSTLVNTSLTIAVPADSTAKTYMDLSGKTVATYPQGSASYGDAQYISDQIVAKGGKAFTIKGLSDATAIGTELSAGRVDAGFAAGDFFAPLVAQGKIKILADPREFKDAPIYQFVNSGMFGTATTLDDKRDAIQRFVKAMVKSANFITSSPTADIAAVLKASSQGDYSKLSTEILTGQIDANKWFLDAAKGCVTPESWKGTLVLAKGFNLPLSGKSLDDAIFNHQAGTDMTFVKGAGVTC